MPGPGFYWIGKEEKREVLDVLNSGHFYRFGKPDDPKFKRKVLQLEEEFCEYNGSKYAIVTNSGTSSLFISLLACFFEPGSEVIVPAYTFSATYTTIIFAGLVPVLTEIDDSLTIDPNQIEKRITNKTKAIMPVHMLGNPCRMDEIMKIAQKHNLMVIEDCAQAAGASYRGQKVGTFGNLGGFSLNVFKTITSGDGGIIVTDDEELFKKCYAIYDHGHNPYRAGAELGYRSLIGLNFRVNELVGAVGLAQLRKLDKIVSTLHKKKAKLKSMISGIEGVGFRTLNSEDGECATILTVIFEDVQKAKKVSQALGSKTLDESGWHVYSNMEHVSSHLKRLGQPYGKGAYPITDDILRRAMNISIGVVDGGLGAGFGININSTDKEIAQVAERFVEACK